jgi:hypothetical protein
LAVTVAVPVSVNVHVFALFPPLEQAPDQIPSRPLEIVSVIDVPVVNGADRVLPGRSRERTSGSECRSVRR